MKFLPLILFITISQFAQAQEKLEVRTRYYSKDGKELKGSEGAYYYMYDTVGAAYGGYSYYMATNKLKSAVGPGEYDEPRRETWYYENGNKQLEGTLKLNFPVGRLIMWHSNGQQLAEVLFPGEDSKPIRGDYKIINYWDSLGTQLVVNGTGFGKLSFFNFVDGGTGKIVDGRKDGVWRGDFFMTGPYEETYDHGNLISGVSTVDGKAYRYSVLSEPATLVKGVADYYKGLIKNLKYPKNARKEKKEGTVFVEFVVQADGTMADFNIIKTFDPECGQAALEAIKESSPKWNPALERGVPIKTRYVLPVKFKL